MRAHRLPQFRAWLSDGDAMALLELAHRCIACRSESDFLALFPELQELLPFDYTYAMSGRHDANSDRVFPVHGINVSFPEEGCREYLSRNYFQVDPIMRQGLTARGVQHYSEEGIDRPREVTSLCLDFGVRQGYVFGSGPLGPQENGSLFFFKGPSMKFDRRFVAVLEFAAPHLHLAFSRVLRAENAVARVIALSSREKEVLQWLEQGKSSWDISVILGISERTVNYHVYNITRKLGVARRSQVLAIATSLGLLGG